MKSDEKFIKYGKTLGGLIHNLNTPLMGISGRVELMQMKLGENKNIDTINAQLDRINDTLTAIGYLLDKEFSNKDVKVNLKELLDNYFSFLSADMRYKHKVEKDIHFDEVTVFTNPSNLLTYLHIIMDILLDCADDDTKIVISMSTTEKETIINIKMICQSEIPLDCDIANKINKQMYDEIKDKFNFTAEVKENEIEIKVEIRSKK